MDKFVVRTPREQHQKKKCVVQEKPLKQATILSLKRVVNVEEILRCKALLDIKDQSAEVILQQIIILEEKIPSREVLEDTKMGLVLNKLRKHENKVVCEKATKLYRKWKQHFRDRIDKPKIEVRFDNSTNKFRSTCKRMIEETLNPHQESSVIAEAMERCLFHINSNTKDSYRRHVRKIVFALRYQSEVKERLLANQLPVEEFCQL